MKQLREALAVKPESKVKMKDHDPDHTFGYKDKKDAAEMLAANIKRLSELELLLYAENKRSLLVVLQAMDGGGKDGTIRHVMSGLNPQGCTVASFKAPSKEELEHDFLWRIHKAVPPKGQIGIFNRPHYEDVLVVRVHDIVPEGVWSKRYDHINQFEKILEDSGVTVLKFFLHISKDEQKKRFEERLNDPTKNWKVSDADFAERKYWDDYMKAFEDALSKCSTPRAPWFVVPANKKWFRNLAVSQIIVETLEEMDLKFPPASVDLSKVVIV